MTAGLPLYPCLIRLASLFKLNENEDSAAAAELGAVDGALTSPASMVQMKAVEFPTRPSSVSINYNDAYRLS